MTRKELLAEARRIAKETGGKAVVRGKQAMVYDGVEHRGDIVVYFKK